MVKRVDNAVLQSAQDFIANGGKLDGGYRSFGLKEDGVGFAVNNFNKAELASVLKKVNALRQDIIDGKIQVPDSDDAFATWKSSLN